MSKLTLAERWLPVDGYIGAYEVSDCGRVRSVPRVVRHCNGRSSTRVGVVRTQFKDGDGRPYVVLSLGGKRYRRYVHHLVLGAFVGPRPPGLQGCHWNDDCADNHYTNLRWGTPSDNMNDRVRNGRHPGCNKLACRRSHLLIAPNLVACRAEQGHRVCLACARARADQAYAKRKGRPFDLKVAADRHYERIMDAA